MKTDNDDLSQRYMVLVKIDATNLFNRISSRKSEYIETFSLKRDRDLFKEIFKCRYDSATLFDFSHLPIEVIEVSNDFYTEVDELYWYLMNTQDMPNTIEDEISRFLHMIEKKFQVLCLYTDAELSGTKLENIEKNEDIPPIMSSSQEFFMTQGEELLPSQDIEKISETDDS